MLPNIKSGGSNSTRMDFNIYIYIYIYITPYGKKVNLKTIFTAYQFRTGSIKTISIEGGGGVILNPNTGKKTHTHTHTHSTYPVE